MEISFVTYKPEYKEDFANLNKEWIENYFKIETQDLKMLEDPEGYIISKGGEIFFAQYKGINIGTVALIKEKENVFELAKMAVDPKFQGDGIGRKLLSHVIEVAKNRKLNYLYLLSNKKLKPAIHLYEALGFKEVPVDNTLYSRVDYKAELYL